MKYFAITTIIALSAITYVSAQCRVGTNPTPLSKTAVSDTIIHDGSGTDDAINCEWDINVSGAKSITIDFNSIDLENARDYLSFESGGLASPKSYTGTDTPPSLCIQASEVKVYFFTDYSVASKGFSFTYTASMQDDCPQEPKIMDSACSERSDHWLTTGTIRDHAPGLSTNYLPSQNCNWYIAVGGGIKSISFDFTKLNIQAPHDTLTFTSPGLPEGEGILRWGDQTNTLSQQSICIDSHEVSLNFFSDAFDQRPGFEVIYTARTYTCDEIQQGLHLTTTTTTTTTTASPSTTTSTTAAPATGAACKTSTAVGTGFMASMLLAGLLL